MITTSTVVCLAMLCSPAPSQEKDLRLLALTPFYQAQMFSFDGVNHSSTRLYGSYADRIEKKVEDRGVSNEEILKLSGTSQPRLDALLERCLPILEARAANEANDPVPITYLAVAQERLKKESQALKTAATATERFPKDGLAWAIRALTKGKSIKLEPFKVELMSEGFEEELERWKAKHADRLESILSDAAEVDLWFAKAELLAPNNMLVAELKLEWSSRTFDLGFLRSESVEEAMLGGMNMMKDAFRLSSKLNFKVPPQDEIDLVRFLLSGSMLAITGFVDSPELKVENAKAQAQLMGERLEELFARPDTREKAAIASTIGLTKAAAGDTDGLHQWMAKAAALDDERQHFAQLYFNSFLITEDWSKAAAVGELYALKSKNTSFKYGLAKAYQELGLPLKLAELIAATRAEDPRDPYFALAELAIRLQSKQANASAADLKLATEAYEAAKAMTEGPSADRSLPSVAALNLGILKALSGDKEAARKLFNEAIQANADERVVASAQQALDALED